MIGWLFWPFISIIVLASVVTGIFNPVYKFIKVKNKINPPFASFLTCIIIFIVLFVPIVFFVGILSNEAYELYLTAKSAVLGKQIKGLLESSRVLESANNILSNFDIKLTGEELNKAISELGKVVGLFLYEQASAIASNVFKLLINFFFMLLIIYFLFIDGNKIISFIIGLSPLPKEQNEKLFQKFKDMAGAILIGNGLGGLIQGTLGGFSFYDVRFKIAFYVGCNYGSSRFRCLSRAVFLFPFYIHLNFGCFIIVKRSRNIEIGNWKFGLHAFVLFFPISSLISP